MYRQHSFEEKLAVVKAFMSGCGLRDICRSRRLSYHLVYDWLRRYKCDGEAGLRTRLRQSRLSPAEKSSIVRDYLERSVPLRELCERHGISRSALREWADQVRRSGYGSLYASKRRGRPPKEDMGRPRKKTYEEMTELEKLQYENMCLKAENALLKKLKALAEEEEARRRSAWRKPSTD